MLIIHDFFVLQIIVKTFLQLFESIKFISVQILFTLFHGLMLIFFLGLKTYEQNIKLAAYVPSPLQLNNKQLTQIEKVKHLGIYLDRKLTSRKHISAKRKQLDLKLRKVYWIIGRKSQLSVVNKLLAYKAILKPIWTYGVQLWGSVSNSNLEILERFQSKELG